MDRFNHQRFFYISWTAISLLFIFFAIYFDGTGGNGDSVYHYLYAKYAWQNHSLYFNHWAKPLFTIVSSPFAQFGFTGIKIFNVLASSFSVLFSYKIAKKLNLKYAHLIFIPLFTAPLFFKVMFSGLTEPFSAFLLSAFLWCWISDKKITAITIISFIPFIRSEGLIILGVIFVFLLWKKEWKHVPLLGIGHVVISIAGYPYYNDALWVFNKIPYAKLSSVYGVGNWTHFINQLYFCLGPILYLLLLIGLIKILFDLFSKENKQELFVEKLFLVYGIFIAFFLAHTSFWALGIFNSMGLNRVFVTVFPLIGIIGIDALGLITKNLTRKSETIVVSTIFMVMLLFTAIKNPASISFKEDLNLDEGMKLVKEQVVPYLESKHPNKVYVSGDVSISHFSNRNIFDKNQFLMVYETKPEQMLDSNYVFIWDPWFARVEGNIELDQLKNSEVLKIDTSFKTQDLKGQELEYIIFLKQ